MLRAGGGCARRLVARGGGGRGARRGWIGIRVRTSHATRRDGTRTLGCVGDVGDMGDMGGLYRCQLRGGLWVCGEMRETTNGT